MNPKNHGVVDAILRAVRRQNPQAKTAQTRADIHPNLLAQIQSDAALAERRRLLAPDLLAKAFQALKF
jgi:hypothetical protein